MRAFGFLTGGVRPDRGADKDRLGVDGDNTAVGGHRKPVETSRSGAALLLADPVVLRAVAGALEPLRARAPRHPASEVNALLVQGDEALGVPGQNGIGVRAGLLGLRDIL